MRHGRSLDLRAVVSPSLPARTAAVTAAPSVEARPSPTAVPAPTYPMDVMTVPDFSPLEVETYFVEPVGTDIQVSTPFPRKAG